MPGTIERVCVGIKRASFFAAAVQPERGETPAQISVGDSRVRLKKANIKIGGI